MYSGERTEELTLDISGEQEITNVMTKCILIEGVEIAIDKYVHKAVPESQGLLPYSVREI